MFHPSHKTFSTAIERKDARGRERFDFAFDVKLADPETDSGTFEGYASVFKLLDQGGDIAMPGAFKASLAAWRKKGKLPPMLWQHESDEPIGIWKEIVEDEKGLRVKGELILDIPQAKIAYALLKREAISGLSIGYRTIEEEYDRTTGARFLKKVDLWEISVVTFPMLLEAQVDGVKNRDLTNFNPREMEGALRDAGFSRADAVKATAIFRDRLQRDAGEGSDTQLGDQARDCLMSLRKATALLR